MRPHSHQYPVPVHCPRTHTCLVCLIATAFLEVPGDVSGTSANRFAFLDLWLLAVSLGVQEGKHLPAPSVTILPGPRTGSLGIQGLASSEQARRVTDWRRERRWEMVKLKDRQQ